MSPFLLDIIYVSILLLGLPFVVYKTLTSSRFRAGWGERFGGVPELAPGPRIWVHCASVGEALVARTLVERLESEYPDADIIFSTNTNTGRETVRKSYPGHTVMYFPLDLSFVVRRVFTRVKPSAVILVELELWPNLLAVARRSGVPVVVVNGRITERSAGRYRRLGFIARSAFRNVLHFAVQNDEYVRRLGSLGVEPGRITVAGTMKYDTVSTEVPDETVLAYRRMLRLDPEETVLLGGCTHPGEEEMLIDFAKSQPRGRLRLILAPRHRERAAEVERLIRDAGLLPVRKTAIDGGAAPADFGSRPHVLLVDTTGELARLYALATAVFVGGSLAPRGGHNVIEPAALGKAVVFGPHTWNFDEPVRMLLENDAAVQVQDAKGLNAALDELLRRPDRRAELGARARNLVQRCKGATERNLVAVRPFLDQVLRPNGAIRVTGNEKER